MIPGTIKFFHEIKTTFKVNFLSNASSLELFCVESIPSIITSQKLVFEGIQKR